MASTSVPASRADNLRLEIFQFTQDLRDARVERNMVEDRMEASRESHRSGQQSRNALVDHLRLTYPEYVKKDEEYLALLEQRKEAIKELEDEILKALNRPAPESSGKKSKKVSQRKVDSIVAKGVLKGVKKARR